MKIALIVVPAVALLTLAGVLLYSRFVGSQIKDGGRMENPDADRAGKKLVEFSWKQNHMNSYRCFTLHFYLENDTPVLTGWFPNPEDGETRKSGTDAFSNSIPWQLTWVQWFELQNMLAESELPEYRKQSPDVLDETDSEICVVWRTEDGEISEKYNGRNAYDLETFVFRIAEEAYAASQFKEELHEVNETSTLAGIYWDQNAALERNCFSFLLDEQTLQFRSEKQMYFSYRYQSNNGETVFRKNAVIAPEKAQTYLSSIEKELRALELPIYLPSVQQQDTMDSCITATWADGNTLFVNRYDAKDVQSELYDLLVEFAEETEAGIFSRPVPDDGWKCPECGMPNGSSVFCAECGTKCPMK